MRKRSREVLVHDENLLDIFGEPLVPPPFPYDEDERIYLIEKVVQSLPDKEKEMIYLRFYDRLSLREVAKRMGFRSHSYVGRRIQAILKKIEKEISNEREV